MGADSDIQWTNHTFNPWWGCAKISPGCKHCYADSFSKRVGLQVWGQDAPRRFFGDKHWNDPRRWHKAAVKAGVRQRVFCASMADVFEDRPDLIEPRRRLFSLIEECEGLDWLLLTKRPENVRRLVPPKWLHLVGCASPRGLGDTCDFPGTCGQRGQEFSDQRQGWPAHVWMGTTVENREQTARIDHLRRIPAAIRFLSLEPLIEDPGPLDLTGIAWAIVGGESGGNAREMGEAWALSIVGQCRAQRVAPFVKQMGSVWARKAGCFKVDSHGGDMAWWRPDLRIREFPQ